jgi:hypothetical protein
MNEWFYRVFPKAWARWWSARLLATSACSAWLHADNPDFTRWQRMMRNALCAAIFIIPGALPLTITTRQRVE